jgi:hypothetical protein
MSKLEALFEKTLSEALAGDKKSENRWVAKKRARFPGLGQRFSRNGC